MSLSPPNSIPLVEDLPPRHALDGDEGSSANYYQPIRKQVATSPSLGSAGMLPALVGRLAAAPLILVLYQQVS